MKEPQSLINVLGLVPGLIAVRVREDVRKVGAVAGLDAEGRGGEDVRVHGSHRAKGDDDAEEETTPGTEGTACEFLRAEW